MERRMLLAVALSFAILYLWMFATGQCSPPPREGGETPPVTSGEGTPEGTPGERGTAEAGPGPANPRPLPDGPATDARGDEKVLEPDVPVELERVVLASEELEVGFTNQGGAIEYVRLQHAYEVDKKTRLDLIVPEGPRTLLGQIDLTGLRPGGSPVGDPTREADAAGILRTARWERDAEAEDRTRAKDVVYVLDTETAIWRKRWTLSQGADQYHVTLAVSRQARKTEDAVGKRIKVLAAAGLFREGWTGAAFLYPNSAIYRYGEMSDPKQGQYGLEVMSGADQSGVRLLGARSHYYLATWFKDAKQARAPQVVRFWATGEGAEDRPRIEASIREFYREVHHRAAEDDRLLQDRIRRGTKEFNHAWMVVDLPSGTDETAAEATAIEMPFYVGPIDRRTLRAPVYAPVKPVVAYRGALDVLAEALLWIYDIFSRLFGSAGVGVILMTLVVRGLMMPLSIKNQLSMRQYSRKIAKLKPELDKLKKKYGNNAQKMREHQSKLYREHGVGFPTGCIMMVVQIPVFFALFSSLRTEYSLRNEAFLWVRDLGAPDKLFDFGKTVVDLGVLQIFSFNVLPLLMVGLSLWQQRLMPKPADEQQAQQMRMMKWLPIVFAVILYNYTAALALYMVLSSALSIVEGKIVRRKDPTPNAPGAAPVPMM